MATSEIKDDGIFVKQEVSGHGRPLLAVRTSGDTYYIQFSVATPAGTPKVYLRVYSGNPDVGGTLVQQGYISLTT